MVVGSQPTEKLKESRVIGVGLGVVVVSAGNRNKLFGSLAAAKSCRPMA